MHYHMHIKRPILFMDVNVTIGDVKTEHDKIIGAKRNEHAVHWTQLFKIKPKSTRKGSGQRAKFDVIRLRDNVRIACSVNGKNKALKVVVDNFKKEKQMFDRDLEDILLRGTND
jgi:hypothetical protein